MPDTVGYAVPELYGEFIKTLRERIPNSDKAIWSVHCHNDLGMAVANSLAGVKIGGARQVECTINGLGERAGNCSLEEIVMAVKTRKDYFGLDLNIDPSHILAASRMVSQTTGFVVQPNKAVVGANAFAHASGIHQDGVLKARDTYEIMRAEDVGWSANKIVLGKLSGRNAFKQRLQDLGVSFDSEAAMNNAFTRFKELADRKSEIFDEDILALVSDEGVVAEGERYGFVSLAQHSETGERPQASVVFTADGVELRGESDGNGPVDASLKAIEAHVKSGAEMVLYSVNAISGSTESQGEVTVRLQNSGPRRQRRRCRPGHRGGVGEGVFERAQQALQQSGSGGGAGLRPLGHDVRLLQASSRCSAPGSFVQRSKKAEGLKASRRAA